MNDGPTKAQTEFFRGIYEFEDPSGSLLAARIPQSGSADLYSGTALVVRPNQSVLFLYKGQITESLGPGTHQVQTENFPVLTKLANWRFGFTSPLRCEIWFFSRIVFTARRWGTTQPVLTSMGSLGTIPLRAYGNYSIQITDPAALYTKLIGGRAAYDISDLEEYVQARILECLPAAIEPIKEVRSLSARQSEVATRLLALLSSKLSPYGLQIREIQVLSLLPPSEVLRAIDDKLAMEVIGNQKEYLLYKAANSLDELHEHSADPMRVMMGLMLGKGFLGVDSREKETAAPAAASTAGASTAAVLSAGMVVCAKCQTENPARSNFCSHCGKDLRS